MELCVIVAGHDGVLLRELLLIEHLGLTKILYK